MTGENTIVLTALNFSDHELQVRPQRRSTILVLSRVSMLSVSLSINYVALPFFPKSQRTAPLLPVLRK